MAATPLPNHTLVRNIVLFVVLCGTVVTAAILTNSRPRRVFAPVMAQNIVTVTIPYDGESFRVAKPYRTTDDYMADPQRLAPSERARAADRVIRKRVVLSASQAEMMASIRDVGFPGFGISGQSTTSPDGRMLMLAVVEVPYASKDRLLLYYRKDDVFELVDDRVVAADPSVQAAVASGETISYLGPDNAVVLTIPFPDVSKRP